MLSKKFFDVYFKPNNPFNCDAAIITDVADVNPTVTGIEIKSINTPVQKIKIRENIK